MDTKIESETAFHNRWYAGGDAEGRGDSEEYYALMTKARDFTFSLLEKNCKNKEALDCGCGLGWKTMALASRGAKSVVGIDLSSVALEKAQQIARHRGFNNVNYRVVNIEDSDFEDGSFDLVSGWGILHHLDLNRGYSEIARILRPSGVGIFIEPLGHNPIINTYRRLTPHLRTPDEHPLFMKDLNLARRYFGKVNMRFFNLTTLFTIPFRKLPFFTRLVGGCDWLDRVTFRWVPFARRYSWMVVLEFAEPIQDR